MPGRGHGFNDQVVGLQYHGGGECGAGSLKAEPPELKDRSLEGPGPMEVVENSNDGMGTLDGTGAFRFVGSPSCQEPWQMFVRLFMVSPWTGLEHWLVRHPVELLWAWLSSLSRSG